MPRKTKEQKRIEAAANDAFHRLASGVQFNIMDLGKVLGAAEAAAAQGEDVDAAMSAAIAQYRQN